MRSNELLEMFEEADQELDDVEELAETLSEFDDDEIEEALRRAAHKVRSGARRFSRPISKSARKARKPRGHFSKNKKRYLAGGLVAGSAYACRRRKRNQE